MKITLTGAYFATPNTTLLGYMGETNSREITFEGLAAEGADGYKLRVSYSDGVQYDIAIEDGKCVVTGSLLREVGYVTLQVIAIKYFGEAFVYVKKSNIFRAEIKESIEGESAPIPTYEESVSALEKVLSIEDSASKSAERAETAAQTAESAVGTVAESATVAKNAAESAENSARNAAESESISANNAKATSQDLTEVKAVAESVSGAVDEVKGYADTAKQSAESAETSAITAGKQVDLAKDEVAKAQGFSDTAESYAKEAENSATKAKEYADNAETYSNSAQSAQNLAEAAQKAAETSATNAADSLTSANTAAENAAQSAKSASESADKAESAKTSAESAMNSAKSYADSAAESESNAKASAESAKEIADNFSADYAELSETVDTLTRTKADGIVETVEGKTIVASDCSDMPLRGLRIFGKTTQGENPTPDNPQELVSVGADGKIGVDISDDSDNHQTAEFLCPNGLPGIKVSSGGNYTDEDGQQWICDEIDLERGIYVQRIINFTLSEFKLYTTSNSTKGIYASLPTTLIGGTIATALCDKLIWIYNTADIPHFYWNEKATEIRCFIPIDVDANTFSANFAGALASPIETALTDEELTAYRNLHTNKLITTFDSDAHMNISYTADISNKFTETNNNITQLKSDLTDIETLINIYHGSTPTSWAEVQAIVRAGLAKKVFSIGDQLTCNKGDDVLTWDIIGIDCDTPSDENYTHSMTLQLHDCYTPIQFDSSEALYYCEEELPAGTYSFTLLANYDTTSGGGKTYQFTTTKAIPAGGQIMFPWEYNTQANVTKISTYADNTTSTALETLSVTEGTDGTNLGTADGNTANVNHTHRLRYGSNNWLESDIRQRINSTADVGAIPWKATTKFARKPSWVDTDAGFLSDIDADFLSVLGEVKKTTARNTVTDGGGSDTSDELMFLLSRSEIYAGFENNINEGEPYPYYANYSDYSSPNVGDDANRIKYRNSATQYWWVRTPNVGIAGYVRGVFLSGALNSGTANGKFGLAPACCIV